MLKSQEIKIFRVIVIIKKKDWEYTAQISGMVLTIQFGMLGLKERK
jgi:uncharacterized membrane protein